MDAFSFANESDLFEMLGETSAEEDALLEAAGWLNNTERCKTFLEESNELYEVSTKG